MRFDGTEFEVSKLELLALLEFTSRDPWLTHLYGVCFDPASGRASATDGLALATCVVNGARASDAPSYIVTRDDVMRVTRAMGPKDSALVSGPDIFSRHVGLGVVLVQVQSAVSSGVRLRNVRRIPGPRFTFSCARAEFPSVDTIIEANTRTETPEPVVSFGMAPWMFGRLRVFDRLIERGRGFEVSVPASTQSALKMVSNTDGGAWTVVLMPMRIQ